MLAYFKKIISSSSFFFTFIFLFLDKFYFAYRVRLGFATDAKSVPQRPGAHAKAHDESASGYHRYQSHRHILGGWRGGGCDFRAQCRTFHLVHLNVLLRDGAISTAADVVVVLFGFCLLQFEFRGFRMILLRRQRRQR